MTLVGQEEQQKLLDVLTEKYGIKKRAGGGSCREHTLRTQPVRRQRLSQLQGSERRDRRLLHQRAGQPDYRDQYREPSAKRAQPGAAS